MKDVLIGCWYLILGCVTLIAFTQKLSHWPTTRKSTPSVVMCTVSQTRTIHMYLRWYYLTLPDTNTRKVCSPFKHLPFPLGIRTSIQDQWLARCLYHWAEKQLSSIFCKSCSARASFCRFWKQIVIRIEHARACWRYLIWRTYARMQYTVTELNAFAPPAVCLVRSHVPGSDRV